MRTTSYFAILAVGLASPAMTQVSAGSPVAEAAFTDRCWAIVDDLPSKVAITGMRVLEQPVRYCRIDGYVTTTDPGPNRVNFMLALPEVFEDRYVMQIQGGAAGFVPDPADTVLRQGFAVASTDKGTRPAHILDFSWRRDPAQARDWAFRGVHVSAEATQAITRRFYQKDFFVRVAQGCSGGGDGTLSNAELYPDDFDGYVAAAMTTSNLEINHLWGAIAQRYFRDPAAWISPEEFARIHTALLSEFDGADGAKDGLIWAPEEIVLDRKRLSFLNDAQFGLLELIANGLPAKQGTSYPGYWLANVSAMPSFLTGNTRPPWILNGPSGLSAGGAVDAANAPAGYLVTVTGAKGFHGTDYDVINELDYSDRAALIADRDFQARYGRYSFDPARLSALKEKGGKLILWTGMADQAVPPGNIRDYTAALDLIHGSEGRQSFSQTYYVPGLHHCSTGEGAPTDAPDALLGAMVGWLESGKPPENVIASNPERDGGNTVTGLGAGPVTKPASRTYLLCPAPLVTRFKGKATGAAELDMNDADNWECRSPNAD